MENIYLTQIEVSQIFNAINDRDNIELQRLNESLKANLLASEEAINHPARAWR